MSKKLDREEKRKEVEESLAKHRALSIDARIKKAQGRPGESKKEIARLMKMKEKESAKK